MKKYMKIALLLSLLIGMFSLALADTVSIGTGTTTTSYYPLYGLYNYNYTQQIYTQAQINTAGNITKIRFYYVSGAIANSKDWVIYMGHTTKTGFDSTTDWVPLTNLTQVFAGDVSSYLPAVNNWMEITLNTPFAYNNTDNLVIAVDENTPNYGSMSWGAFTSGANTGIYYYDDGTNPDPASPPTAKGRNAIINRIQLVFPSTTAPNAPALVAPANNATGVNNPVLSWSNAATGGDATAYDVYFGTNANPPLVAQDITTRSYTVSGWTYSTVYYWKVVAKNAIGTSPASDIWSFTTREDPTKPIPYTQNFNSGTSPSAIEWDANMLIGANHGTAGSNGLYRNLYSTVTSTYATTPPIGPLAANSQILFDYRYMAYSGYPGAALTLSAGDKLEVQVSYNNGAFSTIHTINQSNHVTSTAFAAVSLPISGHAGEIIKVKFIGTWGAGDYYLDIDNVVVREVPQTGILTINPNPVNFGMAYLGFSKSLPVALTNTGAAPITINSITLSNNSNFSLANLPAFPLQIVPAAAPVVFNAVFSPTAEGAISGNILFADGQNSSVAMNGTGASPAQGEICQTAINLALPTVDYLGSSVNLNNDYTATMFTGVSNSSYMTGKDWVGKITIPNLGNLNITVTDQSGYSSQYMGIYLVNAIPSESNPAPVLAQAFGTTPLSIANYTANTGTYYLIIDNWPTPDNFYFKLNVSFASASEPPAPAVVVAPANNATNVSLTPTFSWNAGAGIVEKYYVSYGKVEPYSVIVENYDNLQQRTYTPAALQYGTQYWWKVTPWNSVAGYAQNVPQWTFTTLPDPTVTVFPWTENFEGTAFPPANWARYTGLYPTDTPATTTGGWVSANFANVAATPVNKGTRLNVYGTTCKYWLATPPLAIPATGYELKFDLALTAYSTATPITPGNQADDKFLVLISNSPNMANATVLREWNNTGSPYVYDNIATAGQNIGIDLSAYTGTKYIAFYGESTVSGGDNSVHVDNVTVREIPATPIFGYSPASIDFGTVYQNTATAWRNVNVTNSGAGVINLAASNISLIGANAAMFTVDTSVFPLQLATNQYANIPVRATVTTEGAVSATLRIVYSGNNYDVALSATGLPEGITIIGDGVATQRQPFGPYFGFERSAALYSANEVMGAGAVDLVAWYCATTSATAVPYKVFMGNTSSTSFTAQTWDTVKANLSLVKEGTQTFSTQGWQSFTLDTPFALDGSNLIVAVETNYGGGGNSVYPYFRYSSATTGSHMYWYADNNPPAGNGTVNAQRPNIMLHITQAELSAPAAPILASPANGATNLPKAGFNLSWSADLANGGVPEYYAVFMSKEEDTLFDDYTIEVSSTSVNTAAFTGLNFAYGERWYWTVQAFNSLGDALAEDTFWFEIEDDPSVSSFPWIENFDAAAALPSGWTVVNVDGGGTTWAPSTTQAHSAPNAFLHNYDSNSNQVGWLITPPITLPAATEGSMMLTWWNYSTWPSYMQSNTVKINTTNNPAATGWQQVWSYEPSSAWTGAGVNLNAYLGQTIYVAFVYEGNDANGWFVDDVKIAEVFTDDVPPIITHNPHLNTPITDAPYTIVAQVTDDPTWNSDIAYVKLYWSIDDGENWSAPVNMTLVDGDYIGQIPPQEMGSLIVYYIEAADSEMNITESPVFGFSVSNPLWLTYDTGDGAFVGYNQTFGPAVVFDNPFYGTGRPMQLLAADGVAYSATNATLAVFELQGTSWNVVYSQAVSFPAQNYVTFDLEDANVQINGEQFMIAYMGFANTNGFLFDDTYNYGTSRVIINNTLYLVAEPGQWAIGAHITDVESTELNSPVLNIAVNTTGNPELSWNAVEGATSYIVEYSADPYGASWTSLPPTNQTSLEITAADNARFFRVIATNEIGLRGSSLTLSINGESISATKSFKAPKADKALMQRK